MSKLFSYHYERYGEIPPRSTGKKMMDFDCREEYLKGVYQTKYYYDSDRKPHSHSILICRLIRKSIKRLK